MWIKKKDLIFDVARTLNAGSLDKVNGVGLWLGLCVFVFVEDVKLNSEWLLGE